MPVLRDILAGRMIYFDPGDGRICLVMPFAERVLLGSTDIPAANPDTVICDDNEVDYMLGALRTVFPKLNVNRDHIVFTYSGIRPLPTSDATIPGEISRDHSINVIEPETGRPFPILSLVGGKWTTYRAFAEEVSDIVLQRLCLNRKMGTENIMIGGGRELSSDVDAWEALIDNLSDSLQGDRHRAVILARRYGTRAEDVIAYCGQEDPMVTGLSDVSVGEIGFMVEIEMCQHVADIVLRRLPLAFAGKLTLQVAENIVDAMASINGWSASEKIEQVSGLADIMLSKHRIDIKTGRFKKE
jgi:glycerol-3-phosphate dehydrogenase